MKMGSGAEQIAVFIPMYNCEPQIPRVLAQFDEETQRRFREIVVIDNRSLDGSAAAAEEALKTLTNVRTRLLRNDANYGLGGSHKVAFNECLERGYDYCIILHGDDQGDIRDLLPLLDRGRHREHDCLLGARFMPGSRLVGYSTFRTFGNRVFNALFSLVSGRRLYDLGSGLNLFAVRALSDRQWMRCADDLTFNYYMILGMVENRWNFRFFPLSWREDDQVSNVRLFRQAYKTLRFLAAFAVDRKGFLAADHSGRPGAAYTSTVVYEDDLRVAIGENAG